jgi:hypothetical protein
MSVKAEKARRKEVIEAKKGKIAAGSKKCLQKFLSQGGSKEHEKSFMYSGRGSIGALLSLRSIR